MLFDSVEFLVFFGVVTALYFRIPARRRWALLLCASYVFYMAWRPEYIVLLLGSTFIDYFAAQVIAESPRTALRRLALASSVAANLGLLFAFKYYGLFARLAEDLAGAMGRPFLAPHLDVLLPVGISFYTFQSMAYTIDVYRGALSCEKHAGYFALYVAYYPQLVAGPIERAGGLLPQLRAAPDFDYARVRSGLTLMLWGLFKKAVIADNLAVIADRGYGEPELYFGPELTIATIAFTFQIYCDFSGYSDIAVGCARVMGVTLTENFNRPYLAGSIRDFWRRWHISLSGWFRDYVYRPLGGNRSGAARAAVNVLAVFVLSGLWHGANWTFACWGLIHGAAYLGERVLSRIAPLNRLFARPWLRASAVFAVVAFAWIFFRAASIGDALLILSRLPTGWDILFDPPAFMTALYRFDVPRSDLAQSAALVALMLFAEGRDPSRSWINRLPETTWPVRWAAYLALGWAVLNLSPVTEHPFIYFQF